MSWFTLMKRLPKTCEIAPLGLGDRAHAELTCLARHGSGIGDPMLYNRVGDEITLIHVERIKTLSGRWPR
jgi:hypothetical protein